MVDSLFNYSLLSSLLIKDLEIPVILEKEFTVQCCIRGYHTYQSQWNAEVGAELGAVPYTRTSALCCQEWRTNSWTHSYVLIKTSIFLLEI